MSGLGSESEDEDSFSKVGGCSRPNGEALSHLLGNHLRVSSRSSSRLSILTASDNVKTDTRLELSFEESPFYSEDLKEGAFHATVGMQAVPITIKERNGETVTIESEKPVAYAREDIFLLLDLNAKKARVIGKGRAVTGYGIMWRMQ